MNTVFRWTLRKGGVGLLPVLFWAAGCASVTKTETRRAFDALPADATLSAYVYHERLFLRFRESGEQKVFEASWTARGVEKSGEDRFRTSQLRLLEKVPKDVEQVRASAREARIISLQQFRELLPEVAKRLAPPGAGEGSFLAISDREFVVYRDSEGGARTVLAAQAPPGTQIVRRINLTEFASVLIGVVADAQSQAGDPHRLTLVVGEPREGRAPVYTVFDLDEEIVVVATWPGSAEVALEQASSGSTWDLVWAGLIEGQLFSLIKNPVSYVGRFFNFVIQTGTVVLRSRSWPPPEIVPLVTEGPGMDLPAFETKLDSMMGSNRYKGSIRLLLDGPVFFPVLEQRIAEAKESIHFRMCIWDTDDVAVDVADRVRRQSLVIPDTKVVIDRVTTLGSGGSPPGTPMPAGFVPPQDIRKYLEHDSHVRVRSFLNGMTMGDHSKVIVIDRKYAMLGGMNMGREYRYEWHDAMVELQGPIVGWFSRDFELAWAHASILGDLSYAAAYISASKAYEGPADSPDYVDIRPIYTKTLNPSILRALCEALRRSRRYAWIENPYLYDDTIVRELIAARRRGVDVRVILPSQADMASTDGNNKIKANRLMENGVRVYGYPGMLHTKAALIDGWSVIGSCNFNKLSLRMNFEADVATSDPKFAEEMRRDLFELDFSRSHELTELLPVTGDDRIAEWMAHQM